MRRESDDSGRRASSRVSDSSEDLELARKRLREGHLGLSIVKNGCVLYESAQRRVYGFVDAVKKEGTMLQGASVGGQSRRRGCCTFVRLRKGQGNLRSDSEQRR
jgi:hypothetical protein